MSEKKLEECSLELEECSLEQATHIEMGGKVYEFGNVFTSKGEVLKYNDSLIDVCRGTTGWQLINVDTFPILGIKPLKKKKREPIEFEATFAMYDGQWHTLAILNDSFAYLNNKRVRFRCVEILEEEK
jgi:hypothetical protein